MTTSAPATPTIAVVADYFQSRDTPVVSQTFVPGHGWSPHPAPEPLSRPYVRSLARRGVTSVAVTLHGRTADFRVSELLHVDRRLLFGSGPLPRY